MAISIDELRINDIVLSPKNDTIRRCMVKAIHNDSVSVEILNMQTGKMECEELDCSELEPVYLMESTLYAFGFRKTSAIGYSALYNPSNTSQLLTATIPSMNFTLTRGTTSTRRLTISVAKTTANITTSLSQRTLRNSSAISTGTTYIITPTFLNDRKTTDYNKGKIGVAIGQTVMALNHQSYMADDAKTIIDGIITGNTRTGTIPKNTTDLWTIEY